MTAECQNAAFFCKFIVAFQLTHGISTTYDMNNKPLDY